MSLEKFVVVCWSESQELEDQSWFDECHLILDERGMDIYGSSAYFVPEERVLEMGLDGEN